MLEELARVAHEAFFQDIEEETPWEELPAAIRQNWHNAAEAMLDHHIQLRFIQRLPCPTRLDD